MIAKSAILARVDALPTLSLSISRLSALVHDPDSGAADFEAVIRPDPALTANILKLANSTYFGLLRKVTTVRQAVTLLGVQRIFEVALTASFVRSIPAKLPGYDLDSRDFWRHCAATGVLAERLSALSSKRIPSFAFTAGLLHDMGKLAIGHFIGEYAKSVLALMRRDGRTLVDSEREVLGTDHAEVGALVATHWNLPEPIALVARWHHDVRNAPTGDARDLIDLIHVANALAHGLGGGADIGELQRRAETEPVQRLGLNVHLLEQAACETFAAIDELKSLFG